MLYKSILFCTLAVGLTIDCVLRTTRSNFNFGALLMYCITAFCWIYGIFNKQIDAFCAYGFGRIIKILFFIGLAFLSFMLVFLVFGGIVDGASGKEKSVIVLGAGLRGETVSGVLRRRLDAAVEYYNTNNNIFIVVAGGQGPDEAIPEAHAMKKYLMDKNVPEEKIIVEDKSTSTEENFLFAKELLIEHGVSPNETMAFSTNNFHCYRSKKYAEMAGFTDVNTISASTGFESLMPCYLREVFAVMYLWVFKY